MLNVLFILTFVHQSGSFLASSYLPVLASNGSQLCAVGNVFHTIRTDDIIGVPFVAPGATKCGFFCTGLNRMTNCMGFNYLTSGLCQFFSHMCITTYSNAGCVYYQDVSQSPSYSTKATGLPADCCSLPFTNNGVLYTSCVLGVTCWTVNMTSIGTCPTFGVSGLINNSMFIGGQSVPVQSIFGWLTWMQRVASVTYNWYLPWASFKDGFGSIGDSNYWFGLERVSQLTSSSKYRLRIEMKLLSTSKWISVEYWSFTVGTEANKYQLNVDGFSGESSTFNGLQFVNLCGSLNFPNGMNFSSSDSKNDASKMYNCAAMFAGSWWYNSCGYVSLTGSGTWFRWVDRSCNVLQLAEARMMMKVQ